jgi:hypothetical protein
MGQAGGNVRNSTHRCGFETFLVCEEKDDVPCAGFGGEEVWVGWVLVLLPVIAISSGGACRFHGVWSGTDWFCCRPWGSLTVKVPIIVVAECVSAVGCSPRE